MNTGPCLSKIFFLDQIRRVERYVRKNMTDDQRDEYYVKFRDCSEGVFQRAIDSVIENHRTQAFPLIYEIKSAYSEACAGIGEGNPADWAELEPCPRCGFEGLIVHEADDGYKTVRPCSCARGQRIRRGWKIQGVDKKLRNQTAGTRMDRILKAAEKQEAEEFDDGVPF